MTGVSTAYWLHKNGVDKVTVLESRGICSGATGRNGGHLWPGEAVLPSHIEKHGFEEAIRNFDFTFETVRLVEEFLKENNLIEECEYANTGAVVCALTEKEAAEFQKATIETNELLRKIKDLYHLSDAEIERFFF